MDREELARPQNCPVCGLAMIGDGEAVEVEGRRYDRYACLWCGTVIDTTPQPRRDGEGD